MIIAYIKRILKLIRSDKILNKIESGKKVYFENPLDEIAFKCVPGDFGKPSKYYAKHYGRDEYLIDFDSEKVILAIIEGREISKSRYDRYHLIEGVFWKRNLQIPAQKRQWVITG